MSNNISLDQVQVHDSYNFKTIYESGDYSEDYTDSPFGQGELECNYYEPQQFLHLTEGIKKSKSYFHLNCRSLSSNWESFHDLLCDLHSDAFSFDFIGVSEVFRTEKDSRLTLPGYHSIIARCRDDDGRGGVGLFVKDNINYKIREDLSAFIPHVFESLFIEVINQTEKNTIVGVIYRPNTLPRADVDIFSSTLFDVMDIINSEKKFSVMMGDVNMDLLKFGTHDKTNDYVDGIFSHGYIPVILKPTRLTNTSATLIDHIYSNNARSESTSGIILTDVADHFGIFYIKTDQSKNTLKCTTTTTRSFCESNISIFKDRLDKIDFSDIMETDCPNEAYNKFMVLYKREFDLSFPVIKKRIHKKYIKREPWISSGLLTSTRTKCKLLKMKLRKPTVENINSYKIFINLFNKLKRTMKRNYFANMIEQNKNNMKQTWLVLKKAMGKQNDKLSIVQNFTINNVNVTDKSEIAEEFNKYFSKIGESTGRSVPKSQRNYKDYLKNPTLNSMFLEPIDTCHVIEAANKLKPKLSVGHDDISSKLLKDTIHNIKLPLTHIINKSFSSGIVPDQLKLTKVIPVYKASNKHELKNYRPISLLPVFSKLFEKIMYKKVMSFLDSQNILYKHQYGFRAKHSTIHPLIHLINQCAEANNTTPKQHTMSIFCDLSKAFDVINTDILLNKLNFYGIRGTINKWFSSYLSNRNQYVQIDDKKSDVQQIVCGVPQGSILGPLLYLIYVNDISMSTNAHILSFADDTSMYISDHNINRLYEKANYAMNCLYEWFCANRLSLNPNKTKYIVFKAGNRTCDYKGLNVIINDTTLQQVGSMFINKTTKFLGIYVDESLSWKYQLMHINNKISRSLYGIKQVKHFLPYASLKTLYSALIHPYLSYGILAWGNANASVLHKTIILQKRAIRTIHNSWYKSHTEPLFKRSQILKLNDLHEFQIALFMHDFVNNKLPQSFDGMYSLNCDIRGNLLTRQSDLINIARCDSTFSSRLPIYNFPVIWNKWIRTVPVRNSKSNFKGKLKRCILSTYPEKVKCSNSHCKQCRHTI